MKKMRQINGAGISLFLVVALGACTSPGKKTAIGAGAGAATGAIIGGATGGWKGAAIGAATGGLAGGAVGNYLDKQAKELEEVAETKRTKDGILVNLKNDLLFESGSAVLKDQAIDNISKLGDVLVKYKEDRIRVEGYTDSVGGKTFNETLSTRRADAVKNVLLGRGVQQSQITVLGFGDKKPISNNSTSTGRAANRRVELHIEVPQQAQEKMQEQTQG